jgi:uncharacterized protein
VLLVDTNVLLAAADSSTREHERCAQLLDQRTDLLITSAVAAETAWMIESRLGAFAESMFVASIAKQEIVVVDLTLADWSRASTLIAEYHDLGLGLVDASVVAVAERLGLTAIATMNYRDFSVVRPNHVAAFELIP